MQKKFLLLSLLSVAALSGTALADVGDRDRRGDDDRSWRDRDDRRDFDRDAIRDHRSRDVMLTSKTVSARRGTVTLTVPRGQRQAGTLELRSSDPDLTIRRVVLVDWRGRTTRLRPDRDGTIELGASRNLRAVRITYASRGRTRGAELQLFATR